MMEPQVRVPNLEIGHLFRRAWEPFKQNLGVVMGSFVVYSLAGNLGTFFPEGSGAAVFMSLVSLLIAAPLFVGLCWLDLKLVREEPAEFVDLFAAFAQIGRALAVFWLASLVQLVGLLALIVPGIIAMIGLFPTSFLVLDSNLGVVDCLRRAWSMTLGHKAEIFLLVLAVIGLNLLGFLALMVGAFFTGAFSILVAAAAYDELSGGAAIRGREEPYVPEPFAR